MKCSKAHKLISESIDGSLKVRRAEILEKHLGICAPCRELRNDLRAISGAADRLESPPPSDEVWAKIRSGLAGLQAKTEVPDGSRNRIGRLGWGPLKPRYAGAALAALALVTAGLFFGIRLGRESAEPSFNDSVRYTLAKLDEAEHYYLKAIESLNEAMAAQEGKLGPEVAEMFGRNLLVIDASIQACRQAVREAPDDIEARRFLLAAYMDKVSYLNTVLDFPEKIPAGEDSGIIL